MRERPTARAAAFEIDRVKVISPCGWTHVSVSTSGSSHAPLTMSTVRSLVSTGPVSCTVTVACALRLGLTTLVAFTMYVPGARAAV